MARSLADFEGNDMTGCEARGVFFLHLKEKLDFYCVRWGCRCVRYLAKLHLNGMKCVLEIG